jgi:PD-(D/E)XK endonuclease
MRTYVRALPEPERRDRRGRVAAAAIRLGLPVLKPLSEHGRYDLVLETGYRLWRVQCKWGQLSEDHGVVIVRTGTRSCAPNSYVRTTYTEEEIDLLAVYCGELDRCYLLPVSLIAGRHTIYLRLTAPRNSQRACITLASDHDFAGAVAQLGERLNGIQEARGSSPLSSTPSEAPIHEIGAHEFREYFGYWMEVAAAGPR